MFNALTVFLFLFVTFGIYGQKEIAKLPSEIDEASALLCIDGLFITLNDSGNRPVLFVFNQKGTLVNECEILNSKNTDWEALAYDGADRIFIGDFGNNYNNRKDLAIYSVSKKEVLRKTYTEASPIYFSYPDQKEFPPTDSLLNYDAESLIFHSDSLFIFTKNRTVPFDGKSYVYGLSIKDTVQVANPYPVVELEATNWLEDSVTDAYFTGNRLFLLTYSKVYVFAFTSSSQIERIKEIKLSEISQKEGICYENETLYFVDEKSKSGHQRLYKMNIKND